MSSESLQSLLLAMTGNPGQANESLAQLIEARSEADPQFAAVVKAFQNRKAPPAAEVHEDSPNEQPAAPPVRLSQSAALRRLDQIVHRLYAEVQVLRQRNEQLAAAFGACGARRGEDAACAACGGQGAPGARKPEIRLFRKFAGPVLERAKTRAAAAKAE